MIPKISTLVFAVVTSLSSTGCFVHLTGFPAGDPGDVELAQQGWEKLGERRVDGKLDRDVLAVGAATGRFDSLMIVVEHDALDMHEIEITFADGSRYAPAVRHRFAEGARTRAIDLPDDHPAIREVSLRYANVPGGGPAEVELWGWRSGQNAGR